MTSFESLSEICPMQDLTNEKVNQIKSEIISNLKCSLTPKYFDTTRLQKELNVSSFSINLVLSQLVKEGFVEHYYWMSHDWFLLKDCFRDLL